MIAVTEGQWDSPALFLELEGSVAIVEEETQKLTW